MAIILWVAAFIANGPLAFMLHDNSYKGSIIFGNDPFAYFMFNGVFVATLTIGLIYLLDWLVKWIRSINST